MDTDLRSDMQFGIDRTKSDINVLKERQWHITNYCLLIFAGLVATSNIVTNISCLIKALLFVAAFLTFLICTYWHFRFHKDLLKYRNSVFKAEKKLTEEYRNIFGFKEKPEYFQYFSFTFMFIIVKLTGLIIIGFILFT